LGLLAEGLSFFGKDTRYPPAAPCPPTGCLKSGIYPSGFQEASLILAEIMKS